MSGELSTQRNGIDNQQTKGRVAMNKEQKIGMVIGIVSIATLLGWVVIAPEEWPATTEPPNLYELARQTAENTRHIFWLLAVGFVCLSGLIAHYGRCLVKTRPHDN